jgi:Bacterial Ig domain
MKKIIANNSKKNAHASIPQKHKSPVTLSAVSSRALQLFSALWMASPVATFAAETLNAKDQTRIDDSRIVSATTATSSAVARKMQGVTFTIEIQKENERKPYADITVAAKFTAAVIPSVARVRYVATLGDGRVIERDVMASPFSLNMQSYPPGMYSLSATAWDAAGAAASANTIQVDLRLKPAALRTTTTVLSSPTTPVTSNQLPTVSLAEPANFASVTVGTSVNMLALASDRDGSVAKVEFFVNNTKIGERTSAPYQLTWTPDKPASYSLSAKATDDKVGQTTSLAISFTANAASTPTLSATQTYNAALATWRKVQVKGSCAGCHGADFLDLARIGSSDATIIRRAVDDGATQQEAEQLVSAVKDLRKRYALPTTDPLTFRPFQPGGEMLSGARPIDRDIAFGRSLTRILPTSMSGRVDSLAKAKVVLNELLAVDLRALRVGIAYPRWSADIFNGNDHGSLNDWVADLAREPDNNADRNTWQQIQDTYLQNPSDENFWRMYGAADRYTKSFTVPTSSTNEFTRHKFKSALVGQHMMRVEALGRRDFMRGKLAFSYLESAPYKSALNFTEFLPGGDIWEVGDMARKILGNQITPDNASTRARLSALGMPQFVVDSVSPNHIWENTEEEIRLPWFWFGFTLEPSLNRINGSNSTKVGEYMHGTLLRERMFIHDAFSQAVRMAVQGTVAEGSYRKTPVYAPWYGYFMAYGAEVLNWNEDRRTGEVYEASIKATQAELWSQFVSNNFRMNMYLYQETLKNGLGRDASGKLTVTFPFNQAKRHFDTYQPQHNASDYMLMRSLAAEMGVTLSF